MRRLVIHRLRKFPSAWMPYWIVTGVSKAEFLKRYGPSGGPEDPGCAQDEDGYPSFDPDGIGVRIANGGMVELQIDDAVRTVFVLGCNGQMSDEVHLDERADAIELWLTTKGGWKDPSYPCFLSGPDIPRAGKRQGAALQNHAEENG